MPRQSQYKVWVGSGDDVDNGTATVLYLTKQDYERVPSGRDPETRHKVVRVRDIRKHKYFKIRPADCGLDCWCALEFVK